MHAILLRVIQAFGLTSNPRKEHPPAVDDVSFEAHAGRVTALLGAPGAGKTTTLRLMLELQHGRGITHFRGRPLHRIAHPSREVGVLLGDVPGHPSRTVRGHVRMLCAAVGVPVRRGDEVLEAVGLESLRDERLGVLARGMDRRLGLACALLADPHTLVLDDPAGALCAREARWLHGMLRAHADQGGAVLISTADPKEAARVADRVVTLDRGRVVADQEAADFSRTRLRPRVAVRSPHAARLAALLTKEARAARRSVEVVQESGNRLAVYGSTCADVGEIVFRNGILVHQLADEEGDMGPGAVLREDGAGALRPARATGTGRTPAARRPDGTDPTATRPTVTRPTATGLGPVDEGLPQGEGAHPPATGPKHGPAGPDGLPGNRSASPDTQEADRTPETRTGCASAGDDPVLRGAHTEAGPVPGQTRCGDDPEREETRAGSASVPEKPSAGEAPVPATRAETAPVPTMPTESDTMPAPPVEMPLAPEAPAAADPESGAHRPAPVQKPGVTRRTPRPRSAFGSGRPGSGRTLPSLPPPISVRSAPSPLRPLRYELRRVTGVGTAYLTGMAVLAVSAVTAVILARVGHTPQPRLLAAWPRELPLPPAALGAGLLGALAFGDEFRHPALAADRGTVPRRLGLLTAKLLVSAATALVLAVLTVGCDAEVLHLFYGQEVARVPADWPALGAGWLGLCVGCAWSGVLAAGIFRSTTAGLAAVVAVPVLVVPLVQKVWEGPSVRTAAGLSLRLREVLLSQWPFGGQRHIAEVLRVLAQPVGGAMTLSLTALLCAYLLTTLRSRPR